MDREQSMAWSIAFEPNLNCYRNSPSDDAFIAGNAEGGQREIGAADSAGTECENARNLAVPGALRVPW
jgi:hypothetical protein